jgi:hypothetical protein
MERSLEKEIRRLARNRCEYCGIPDHPPNLRHVLDHIIARQHGGQTVLMNLALCCGRCNLFKGPNIANIDPATGAIVPLFHPRRDLWSAHFHWDGPVIVGQTPTGRATVGVLAINLPVHVARRRMLIEEGLLLPKDNLRAT